MKLRILLIFVGVLSVVVSFQQPAYAHVLVTDKSGKVGAIFHVDPDDEPVAGSLATLSLTPQIAFGAVPTASYVTITNQDGSTRDKVVGRLVGNNILYAYSFPTKGVYKLQFSILFADSTLDYDQSQLVSKGIGITTVTANDHPVAEGILVGSGVVLIMLLIVGATRWKILTQKGTDR